MRRPDSLSAPPTLACLRWRRQAGQLSTITGGLSDRLESNFDWKAGGGAKIALRTYDYSYVVAEGGGGGDGNANRDRAGEWETFTIEFQ